MSDKSDNSILEKWRLQRINSRLPENAVLEKWTVSQLESYVRLAKDDLREEQANNAELKKKFDASNLGIKRLERKIKLVAKFAERRRENNKKSKLS